MSTMKNLLLTFAALRLVGAQVYGPFPRTFPVCSGSREAVKIRVNEDADGNELMSGDTVSTLPEGTRVVGRRLASDSVKPTRNDLVLLDTTSVETDHPLRTEVQGNALFVARDVGSLEPSENGGQIEFRFDSPLYSVNSIKFVHVNSTTRSFITGLDAIGRTLDQFEVNTRGDKLVSSADPVDWLNVRSLDVILGGAGAITNLQVTVCRDGDLIESCPTGARITEAGFCIPCDAGFFLDENECKECPVDTIAEFPGLTECSPCGPSEVANLEKTLCIAADDRVDDEPMTCQPGTYKVDNDKCKRCPQDEITTTTDQLSCITCVGDLKANKARTECVTPCRPGFFGDGGEDCQPCPPDRFSSKPDMKNCRLCPEGLVPNSKRKRCRKPNDGVTQGCTAFKEECEEDGQQCCFGLTCRYNSQNTKKQCRCQKKGGTCSSMVRCCGIDLICQPVEGTDERQCVKRKEDW